MKAEERRKWKAEERIVVYSNIVVSARQPFTVTQNRVIKAVIYQARKLERGFSVEKPLIFKVEDYVDAYDLKHQRGGFLYRDVYSACEKLIESHFYTRYWDQQKNLCERRVPWLSFIEVVRGLGEIRLAFNPLIEEQLHHLTENFTSYNLRNITGLRTNYAIRLYELMAQFKKVGERYIKLDECRIMLDTPKHYKTKDFNQKILRRSIDTINATTDLHISVTPTMLKKRITGYDFLIKTKDTPKNAPARRGSSTSQINQSLSPAHAC